MRTDNTPKTEFIYQSLVKNNEEKDDDLVIQRKIDVGDTVEVVFERVPNNAKNKFLALTGLLKLATKDNVQAYYESMGMSNKEAHETVMNHVKTNASSKILATDIEKVRWVRLQTTEPDARIEDYAPKGSKA